MTKLGVVPLAAAPAILGIPKAEIPRLALLKKSLRFVEEFITLKVKYIPDRAIGHNPGACDTFGPYEVRVSSLFVCLAALVQAQTSSGTIDGTVQDASGAMIAGAQVRLIGAETGEVVRELTTGPDGHFAAPLIRPMTYTVEASAAGFKKLVRSGIILRVDDSLNLKLALEIGAATESINVSASVDLLEQSTNTVGQAIDERTMQQLPLNGRNYLQLGSLTAGTVPNTRTRDLSFSAYGNRGLQNAFLLDGARNQNYLRGLDNRARDAMRPSLEAISEFKVQTSNYSAEYGASAGAVVTVVTRSGTNEFHGSAFEFLRNSAFDARDYFLPASAPEASVRGAPVRRLGRRAHHPEPRLVAHRLPALPHQPGLHGERRGAAAAGTQRRIRPADFRPADHAANPDGAGSIRDAFPNNTIPAARFDKLGKNLVGPLSEPEPMPAGSTISTALWFPRAP